MSKTSGKISRSIKGGEQSCLFCLEPCPSMVFVSPLCNCPCSYHNACKKKWDKEYPHTCPICRNQIIQVVNSNSKYNIGSSDDAVAISIIPEYQESPYRGSTRPATLPVSVSIASPSPMSRPIQADGSERNNTRRNVVSCLISVFISVGIIVILKVAGNS